MAKAVVDEPSSTVASSAPERTRRPGLQVHPARPLVPKLPGEALADDLGRLFLLTRPSGPACLIAFASSEGPTDRSDCRAHGTAELIPQRQTRP
jgi:hypothetical protein